MPVRLQKFLADAGVASRRAGEQMIREGRVVVNGIVITGMGAKMDPDHDRVTVDGRSVRVKRKIYLAMHKPRGLVCSHQDEHGRPTIYGLLPAEWGHLHSVGRLDFNSEGLLFLTNDGQFSLKLTHPRYGVRKHYIVSASGLVTREMLKKFEAGVRHDGDLLKAVKTVLVSASDSNSVVELELTEGKNREVRRMFESQGLLIKRLQRVQIGKIKLGELRPGRWRTLTEAEIKTLLS
jgi:23S rRNA pseudouridine2605 synthase